MSMSSYCMNCGQPKQVNEFAAHTCGGCSTARAEAIQGAKAENPELSEDQLLYVGRQALAARQHSARQTYISPRDFDRAKMEK